MSHPNKLVFTSTHTLSTQTGESSEIRPAAMHPLKQLISQVKPPLASHRHSGICEVSRLQINTAAVDWRHPHECTQWLRPACGCVDGMASSTSTSCTNRCSLSDLESHQHCKHCANRHTSNLRSHPHTRHTQAPKIVHEPPRSGGSQAVSTKSGILDRQIGHSSAELAAQHSSRQHAQETCRHGHTCEVDHRWATHPGLPHSVQVSDGAEHPPICYRSEGAYITNSHTHIDESVSRHMQPWTLSRLCVLHASLTTNHPPCRVSAHNCHP